MNLETLFQDYERAHQHPGNRLCHTIGIPLIIVALVLLIQDMKSPVGWVLFTVGWFFQILGHWIEGTKPEFLRNPLFLIVGPLYFLAKLRRRS